MSCLITNTIFSCNSFNLGGIGELYITNNSSISDIYFLSSDTKTTNITNFVPYSPATAVTWTQFNSNPYSTKYEENSNYGVYGHIYNKVLTIEFEKLEPEKRSTLKEWINSKNITILFSDLNGTYWVIGEERMAKVTEYNATTGGLNQENKYKIAISVNSKHKLRSVDSTYINTYVNPFVPITPGGGCISCSAFRTAVDLDSISTTTLTCVLSCSLS